MSRRMHTAPVRILLVEDEDAIRDALVVALTGEGYRVSGSTTGLEALEDAQQFLPDLALLDVRLPPGPDGLAVARLLRKQRDLPVLFLTAADSLEDCILGFHAGADDYVVKPFSMAELLLRVRALLRRSGRLESAVWQVGDLLVDAAARNVVRGGERIDLTRTEFEILALLGRHRGHVVSKEMILAEIWTPGHHQPNVVEAHVSALRRKIEADRHGLVETVRGVGYIMRP